jgi:hypothetical protein
LRLRYVAREVDPREFAPTPTRHDGARKFQIAETANGDADLAGIQFHVPEIETTFSSFQYVAVLKALPVILRHSMQLQQWTRNGSSFNVIDSWPHEQVAVRCIWHPPRHA